MVLLEFWACLEGEGGVEASVAESSLLCDLVTLLLVHLCPPGAVGVVVAIVPYIQASLMVTSGVQYLAYPAVIVGGAAGTDLVPLRLPGIAGEVLHIVIARVRSLCSTADVLPTLKSGSQFLESGSGRGS